MLNPREVDAVNNLLADYSSHISAYCLDEPAPRCYSLELEFDVSEEGQSAMQACKKAYEARTMRRQPAVLN